MKDDNFEDPDKSDIKLGQTSKHSEQKDHLDDCSHYQGNKTIPANWKK